MCRSFKHGRTVMTASSIPIELWPVILSLVVGFFKAFRFVHEGEQGIKLRFGKAVRNKQGEPRVIKPGFAFLVPFVDTLKRHHVRQETIRFDHQQIMIQDGLIFNVSAIVIFRIKDIYKALFEIENLEYSIEDLGMGILRDEISKRSYTELEDTEKISQKLLDIIRQKAEEWGIEFIQFKLTSCAPSTESAHIIFSKIGVRFKLEALREASSIIAELDIDSGLASVLVGTPLVASTSVSLKQANHRPPPKKQNESFMDQVFDAIGSKNAEEKATLEASAE